MKNIIIIALAALSLTACKKSIEDKAAEEARAYTQKFCPTPVYNLTRTDSLGFDRIARRSAKDCCSPSASPPT